MDLFVRGLTGQEEDEEGVDVAINSRHALDAQAPFVRSCFRCSRSWTPSRARTILRSLLRIELLNREHVLLALPGEIDIR